ncbi:acyltransferase [Iodobacter sp. LRB]|uniref:acyltransferase n=1 Tax=unclassified Iodobacter TaxID=235634 RepID=UPI0026CE8A84|nr:acyltransferase [Iodobacter sp. BJB302]
MPCEYQNIYLIPPELAGSPANNVPEQLIGHQVRIGLNTHFSGTPRLSYTRVIDKELLDADLAAQQIDEALFAGSITIGSQCYIESGHIPAFHNLPVKLSTVQINDGPVGQIKIGDRVVLQGAAILAYQRVEIGNDVIFGPMVTIMDSSGHPLLGRGQPGEAARIRSAPVRIGNGVWIGAGATILKGVTIGEGAVIGTQAVVSEDVPPFCVVTGNPARVVKHLQSDQKVDVSVMEKMLAVF